MALTIGQGVKLSGLIDKMDIRVRDPKANQEAIGADLMIQVVSKAYKAGEALFAFVAEYKGVTLEEAKNVDLFEFIGEIMGNKDVVNFFTSQVS